MSAIWRAIDSNQQMGLVFILTVSVGVAIGAWSWHRATHATVPDSDAAILAVAQDFAAEVDAAKVDEAVDFCVWEYEVSS